MWPCGRESGWASRSHQPTRENTSSGGDAALQAVQAAGGTTAEAFIAARIILEAKRLLVHPALPVAAIPDKLSFDEPTNFSKFFRREVGCLRPRGSGAAPGRLRLDDAVGHRVAPLAHRLQHLPQALP